MGCPRPNVPNLNAKDLADVHEPLRSMMHTAIIDAHAEGLVLYLVSGGRSDGQQWDLRHDRVPAGHECDPAYKGHPTTALPGRSHHRNISATICAADMGGALAWLHAHADDYGIHFPVPGEAWHAEPTGRTPRRRIIPFGAPTAPVLKPRRWLPFGPGQTDASIAAHGGFETEVTEVQLILTSLAAKRGYPDLHPGPVDGDYRYRADGSEGHTQLAVRAFKRRVIGLQRATGQKTWPNDDANIGQRTIDMLRRWNKAL